MIAWGRSVWSIGRRRARNSLHESATIEQRGLSLGHLLPLAHVAPPPRLVHADLVQLDVELEFVCGEKSFQFEQKGKKIKENSNKQTNIPD